MSGFRDHRGVQCAGRAERPPRGRSRRAPLRPVGNENRGGAFAHLAKYRETAQPCHGVNTPPGVTQGGRSQNNTKGPSLLDVVLRPRGRVGPPGRPRTFFGIRHGRSNRNAVKMAPRQRPSPTTRSIVEMQKDVGIIPLDDTYAITDVFAMQTVTATTARSMIYKLLDDASESHEPIQITGKRSSAVLVAEDDWRAIQESLYLVSIPGMRESIRAGLATRVSACAKKLDW